MKIVSVANASRGEDVNTTQSPVRVCLHILRVARTDIRAKRAATSLIEAGFEVSIIDVEYEGTRSAEENFHGINMKHLIIPSWHTARLFEFVFFLKAVQTLFLSIRRLIQTQADIYHASELTALPACFIAAKLRCKPLIFEIYDLQFPVPTTSISFWRRSGRLLSCLQGLILSRCAGVIATSPLHVQEISHRFHIQEVSLLRNLPTYRIVQKSDRLRQYLGLSPDTRIVLYQGGLMPGRGLDKLIRAALFLEQNIVIVMMGQNMIGTQAHLEALIASEGVGDRVKIIPAVPYEELLDWTSSADIGITILPLDYTLNVRTSLPNKVFEYIMAGLPVLSSSVEAVAEVIRIYDVGQIMPSLAPADVAASINSMLADRLALARMRDNALNAAKELCWEKESPKLIRLYKDILARSVAK